VRRSLQERFTHYFVDEFQDTSVQPDRCCRRPRTSNELQTIGCNGDRVLEFVAK